MINDHFNPEQNATLLLTSSKRDEPMIFGTNMLSARNFTCHLTKTKRRR